MFRLKKLTPAIAAAALLLGPATVRADDEKPKPKPGAEKVQKPDTKPETKPGGEGQKPVVIQLDASKLPPDVLKKLLELSASGQKPGATEGDKKPAVPEKVKPGTPDKPKPGSEPVKPGAPQKVKPGAEPVKPGTPDKVKPGAPGKAKTISLADAIAIAEKTTQGTAVTAGRGEKDGAVYFKVALTNAKGGEDVVVIDGAGNVIDGGKGGGEKGKPGKKPEGDEKGEKGKPNEKPKFKAK